MGSWTLTVEEKPGTYEAVNCKTKQKFNLKLNNF